MFEGVIDYLSERVDTATGLLVPYRPPSPPDTASSTWAWDEAPRRWAPVKTLSAVRADKWASIKEFRDAAIFAALVTPHGTFDGDSVSQSKIAEAAQYAQALVAAGRLAAIVFTLADNTRITLDAPAMASVGLLLGDREQSARAVASALRDRIDAATSADDVSAITWPAS